MHNDYDLWREAHAFYSVSFTRSYAFPPSLTRSSTITFLQFTCTRSLTWKTCIPRDRFLTHTADQWHLRYLQFSRRSIIASINTWVVEFLQGLVFRAFTFHKRVSRGNDTGGTQNWYYLKSQSKYLFEKTILFLIFNVLKLFLISHCLHSSDSSFCFRNRSTIQRSTILAVLTSRFPVKRQTSSQNPTTKRHAATILFLTKLNLFVRIDPSEVGTRFDGACRVSAHLDFLWLV